MQPYYVLSGEMDEIRNANIPTLSLQQRRTPSTLSLTNFDSTQNLPVSLNRTNHNVGTTLRVANNTVSEDIRKLANWLCPPTICPNRDQEFHQEIMTSKTGTWIYEHRRFQKWKSEPGTFLWLYGSSDSSYLAFADVDSGVGEVRLDV